MISTPGQGIVNMNCLFLRAAEMNLIILIHPKVQNDLIHQLTKRVQFREPYEKVPQSLSPKQGRLYDGTDTDHYIKPHGI